MVLRRATLYTLSVLPGEKRLAQSLSRASFYRIIGTSRLVPPGWQSAQRRELSSSGILKMASDEAYLAFLNKANQDVDDAGTAASQRPPPFKTTDAGSEVPQVIRDAIGDDSVVYVSEADEPFYGVSLRLDGAEGLPDEVEFARLIHHWDPEHAEVDIMDPVDWDTRAQYTGIIDAVVEATRGNDVRVYGVTMDSTRTEFWVVSWDDRERRIVGVKTLGVQS